MVQKKEILTKEILKKNNTASKTSLLVVFILSFSIIAACIIGIIGITKINEAIPEASVIAFVGFLFSVIIMIIIFIAVIKGIKQTKKDESAIDDNNFKIVVDKIYDKYENAMTNNKGRTKTYYFVYSKIYGEIPVEQDVFDAAQKNESIYLLFLNGTEQEKIFDESVYELYKNIENINQSFLPSMYELNNELKERFIPYDATLGELNFNSRIAYEIKELEENKCYVTCKKCNKEYSREKHDVCPECGALYKFDVNDVLQEKRWD